MITKKGQIMVFGSTIIIIILLAGILIYQGDVESKNYVGDKKIHIVYNIKSINQNCKLNEIQISQNNVVLFATLQEAIDQGYELDQYCN